jgi:hypothetical protein
MTNRYILGSKEVMAIKLDDNEESLNQVLNLLGNNFVGFVYKQGINPYCAIKWADNPPIYANIGDWIVKNENNTFEVLKDDIFMREYESLFIIAKVKKKESKKTTWIGKFFKKIKYILFHSLIYLIILSY